MKKLYSVIKGITPCALAIVFFLLIVYTFSPGLMSYDSFVQYKQAIGETPLDNAHPVIMAYVWRFLLKIYDDNGVMLIFHQLFYWVSITLLVYLGTKNIYARIVWICILGICPPLLITSLHIWKDVGMMVFLSFSCTLIYGYIKNPHWGWIIGVVLSLFYASVVRVNGFIPAFFLLYFLCYLIVKKYNISKIKTFFSTISLLLVFSLMYMISTSILTSNIKKSYGLGTLIVWDIVEISLAQNKDLLPEYLEKTNPENKEFIDVLRKHNSSEANFPSYNVVSPYPTEQYQSKLSKDWLSLVLLHPYDYLKHRAHLFAVIIGILDRPIYYPFHPGIDINDKNITFKNISKDEFYTFYIKYFDRLSKGILYKPWIYFLLSVIVLLISSFRIYAKVGDKDTNIFVVFISSSGMFSTFSLFFIATAADYRYVIWMIFSSLIATFVLYSDFKKGNKGWV